MRFAKATSDSILATRRRAWALGLLVLLVSPTATGCAGYQFGADTLYRSDVQTIAVVMVESESFRPFLGERLTEAIVREVQQQTPYRIAPASTAQSVLRVRILSDTKQVLGENANDEPRDLQVGLRADVVWTNRLGQTLMSRQSLLLDEYENFIPEGGQSMVTAQQDMIDDLAQRIVSSLEAEW